MRRRQSALLVVVVLTIVSVAGAPVVGAQATVNANTAPPSGLDVSMTIGAVDVSPENPTTETKVTITPTIRNSERATQSAQITEVSVTGSSILQSADNVGRLGPGNSISVPLSATFETAGQHRLTVYARGTDADGNSFVVEKPVFITVEQRSVDVGVSAAAKSVNGSTGIEATVTQYGTVAITSGQVQAIADGHVLARAPISNVTGSESQTVFFEGSDLSAGEITIRARYTVDGEQRTRVTNTTIQYAPQTPAEMALTGIEVTGGGTTYTISGDASNLGGADANAVLVDVAATEQFSTNGGYFIGTIERSEFATFELTVTADSPVETIPVRVNYSVDGEQYSQTTTVDVSDVGGGMGGGGANAQRPPNGPPGGSGGGGLPMGKIGLGVGALVLVGVLVAGYRWRNP